MQRTSHVGLRIVHNDGREAIVHGWWPLLLSAVPRGSERRSESALNYPIGGYVLTNLTPDTHTPQRRNRNYDRNQNRRRQIAPYVPRQRTYCGRCVIDQGRRFCVACRLTTQSLYFTTTQR